MAPPKHVDLLGRYRSELGRSKRWRNTEDHDDLWRRLIDLYRGRHYASASPDDRLVINMAFATKNVIAPSVAVNNPKFVVNARKMEQAAQAMISEEVLNYLWRVNDYQHEFRLAVDDFLTIGHGWVKCGYKFVKEEVRLDPDPYADGVDDRDPDMEGTIETETVIVEDRPFIERVSPFDIYVDPDAKSMRDLRWIAHRVRRPVMDVRVDSRYSPKFRKDVQPTLRSRWDNDEQEAFGPPKEGTRDTGFCDVIEYYDVRRGTMAVFADGATDGFLIAPKRMPYAFGHPFVMLRNYEVPDQFYPMGELEAIEALQLELNETRTQMLNHRKRFARKWLYLESAFDDRGVSALESDEDNTMVPVQGGERLDNVIVPLPAVGTPPDFYNQSSMIQGDINTISGVSDYMRGATPEIRRTATEAAMMQDAQNARAADKLARIELTLAKIGERLLNLMQQFMVGTQVIRVVGATAMPLWIEYDRDYIAGQFDFEVEAGSTQPRNESFRRQAALQLVDAMAPFVGAGVVDMQALARHVLQNGFGIKTPDTFLMQQPMMPGAPGQMPPGMPPGPQGGMEAPPEMPMDGGMPGMGGIDPQVLSQLQTTVGLDLPNLG